MLEVIVIHYYFLQGLSTAHWNPPDILVSMLLLKTHLACTYPKISWEKERWKNYILVTFRSTALQKNL